MSLTAATKRKITTSAIAILVSTLFGFMYPFVFGNPDPSAGPTWHVHLNGIFIGFLAGLALVLGELFVFSSRLRRCSFSSFVLLQAVYHLVCINISVILVMSFHGVLLHGRSIHDELQVPTVVRFLTSGDFLTINAYALVMLLIISFMRQVNRSLGHNALVNFVSGKYHNPVEEERIFMFLDLNASTSIAEKLGDKQYHEFLNDFFYDITPAIIESNGEIYQYVGDEVVITWKKENGVRDANCIACYFRVAAAIAMTSERYERRYGMTPSFKAGYHSGKVIAGLIGDIKRDIVFHGDTVNTAARIRSECSVVKRDLLLSGDLLAQLSIGNMLTPESMGRIKLRGKAEEIELYSLREAA